MPPPPSRWTLRTKLLASVLVLFVLVMLATSALTVLETRRYLEAQLVADLDTALVRLGEGGGIVGLDRPGNGNGNGLGNGTAGAHAGVRSGRRVEATSWCSA